MIPAAFEYARARTVRDALGALAAGDGTKLLAGGMSLLPMMRFRLAQPPRLLDIGGLAELRGIAEKGRGLRIGALTTYRELLDSALVAERAPLVAEVTRGIADLQVRNRGTIGGALAHADPAAEMPAALLALDATLLARSRGGKRSIPAREFFLGAFTTALAGDELLTDIVLPALPRGAATAYASFEQQASGYPLAGAAAVVVRSRKTVTGCTVALTGVADRAVLVASAARLVGTKGEPAALDAAAADAALGLAIAGDLHAPAAYRAELARLAVRRALAAGRAERFGSPKLLAPIAGREVLGHVLVRLGGARAAGLLAGVLVLHREGDDAIRTLAGEYRCTPLAVRDPDGELAHTLRVGFEFLSARGSRHDAEAALICPGDQPLLRLDVIRALVDSWSRNGVPAIRPSYRDDPGAPGHPLLLDRSLWHLASELRGDAGFGPLLERRGVRIQSISVGGANPDVDTPEDLKAVEASGATGL